MTLRAPERGRPRFLGAFESAVDAAVYAVALSKRVGTIAVLHVRGARGTTVLGECQAGRWLSGPELG